jgi:hypothetical protein
MLKHTEGFQDRLFEELKGRIKKTIALTLPSSAGIGTIAPSAAMQNILFICAKKTALIQKRLT